MPAVLVVSKEDGFGGASRAAWRTHHAFLAQPGLASTMVVSHGFKKTDDPTVHELAAPKGLDAIRWQVFEKRRRAVVKLSEKTRPRGLEPFQEDLSPEGERLIPLARGGDIVNLHWVARFVAVETVPELARQAPVVWTLHDMLPFTGGCHYDHGCGKWRAGCGACPQLGSTAGRDRSSRIFDRKQRAYAAIPRERLAIVAPSRWLALEARRSPLFGRFHAEVIPNPLDLATFRPVPMSEARRGLGLPEDRPIVLFAADHVGNARKGAADLLQAMAELSDPRVLLVALGEGDLPQGPTETRKLGPFRDDLDLARAYAAADLFVLPSVQDNLPNTLVESLACATPVLGTEVGGIPDLVIPGETGMLVPPRHPRALRELLDAMLRELNRLAWMGRQGRALVERECAPAVAASRYARLFDRLLAPRREE
jgi:glycosyltransferase involved in cell wall biosynthesis